MADRGIDYQTYSRVTRLIYGAVFDQAKWESVLVELTKATGGVRTHMLGFDAVAGISLGHVQSGWAPEYMQSYDDYYGTMNAWAPGFARGEPGMILTSEWMCPREELFATEFYHEWVRPQEDVAISGGAVLFKDETRVLIFGGNIRLKDEEKLERSWLRTVGLLIPHLQQAFEISRALAGRSLELELLRNGHAARRAAVLLLAENGCALYANDVGEAMLTEGRVLRLDHAGRVDFSEPEATAALEKCLLDLRARKAPVAATFPVGDELGASRWKVRIAPFDPSCHEISPFPLVLGYSRPCLLVTMSPERRNEEGAQSFMRQCGFTDAESAVSLAIADGLSPGEIAERRDVSIHTIRNQIKSAMAKMEVHRQIELVRMIETLRSS